MYYFIVTCPESGWDCVVGLYCAESISKVEDSLKEEFGEDWEESYVIHERILTKV